MFYELQDGEHYLNVGKAHDRTLVFINEEMRGVLSRSEGNPPMLVAVSGGDVLTLVVESLGHVTSGTHMNDFKVC